MPEKLLRCLEKVRKKSKEKYNPWAICINSTGLKPENKSKRRKNEL